MTTSLQKLADGFDPHNRDELTARETKFLTKIPESGLILKLIQFSKGKSYIMMDYFSHQVGPSQKDMRTRACLKSLNQAVSPEKDKFWETKKIIKELRLAGGNPSEIARYEAIAKKFKPSQKAWVLAVTPGNPKLMAVRVAMSVIDEIFGVDEKKANDYRPARKGLLNDMLEQGRSPFDLRSDLGWIKITKTGEGLGTKYQVAELVKTVSEKQGNKTVTFTEPESGVIHPNILELTVEDIPDVYKYEGKSAFTLEESEAFVKSLGTEVPERLLPKKDGGKSHYPSSRATGEVRSIKESNLPPSSVSKYADEDDYSDEVPF
jgi:hypothetical protein